MITTGFHGWPVPCRLRCSLTSSTTLPKGASRPRARVVTFGSYLWHYAQQVGGYGLSAAADIKLHSSMLPLPLHCLVATNTPSLQRVRMPPQPRLSG